MPIRDLTNEARMLAAQQNNTPWTRPTELMGPGRPVLPANPEEQPRLFEYQTGINLMSVPRHGFGLVSFQTLRNLAGASKEIRLNIELIKREVRALDWEIVPASEKDKSDYAAEIDGITRVLESPDGYHDFDQWINILLEEMLVIDAVTVWPELSNDGGLQALELIAGDTIRPLLDFRGRVPPPPTPAYIQVMHGVPTSYFSRDRLIYRPFNATASSPYGTSPIEFIILAVNLALRRDTYHVASFTEGNVPEALVGAPSTWSQEQVDTWQRYWDAMVQGNLEAQRKMHWVPIEGGRGQIPVYEFHKDDINQTPRDEWLMRVACWAFGNSPAEFGITPGDGLGGAGFTASMENVQYRSMLGPVTQYVARLLNGIVGNFMQKPHLKFKWVGMEPHEDKLVQAQVDEIYTRIGVYDVAYVQDRLSIPTELRPAPGMVRPSTLLLPNVSPVTIPSPSRFAQAAPEEGAARKFFQGRGGEQWFGYG